MPSGSGFAFGAYQLDLRTHRLLRDGTLVPLRPRHLELLRVLVSRAGDIVTKDELIDAAWRGVVVEENTLAQAISQLRSALDPDDPKRYIETVSGYGYRFIHPAAPIDVRQTDGAIDALLAPHRALIDGRAALETLERTQLHRARSLFTDAVRVRPDDPTLRVGLANAGVLQFEATRTDSTPDAEALDLAFTHAREACRLAPDYAEAWATLGFVLERTGARSDAIAALRQATTIEPTNWRHHLRLAYGSWGEERLRAAERTLAILPGCPMAHLLAATVYVARDALTMAEREVSAGVVALPVEADGPTRYSMVALYWLQGLLQLAQGREDEARVSFARELGNEERGHLYAREACANAWYAIGACDLKQARVEAAATAFEQAIARVCGHPLALAGLSITGRPVSRPQALNGPGPFEVVLADAVLRVAGGDVPAAVATVAAGLASAPAGSAGWMVPIEPLLNVRDARPDWAPVLATLRTRAS